MLESKLVSTIVVDHGRERQQQNRAHQSEIKGGKDLELASTWFTTGRMVGLDPKSSFK